MKQQLHQPKKPTAKEMKEQRLRALAQKKMALMEAIIINQPMNDNPQEVVDYAEKVTDIYFKRLFEQSQVSEE